MDDELEKAVLAVLADAFGLAKELGDERRLSNTSYLVRLGAERFEPETNYAVGGEALKRLVELLREDYLRQ